ncbi:MAG: glycosyltransferase family 87 protein [Chloroflexota bacterium]
MSQVTRRTAARSSISASSILVWLGLALLALVGAWHLLAAWEEGSSGGRDFVQDYAAIVKIGQGRDPYEPYNDVTQELFGGPPHRGPLYSFHAPSSLPLMIWLLPIAKLDGYRDAFLAWGFVSVLSLWAVCWLTLRALAVPKPEPAGLLMALTLVSLPAIRQSFEEGQLNVVVAAGMVGCWAARRSGRSGLAGVLLGAAFSLKPIPGLFFLYYAWRRDWRLVGAAVATVFALSVVGVALSGVHGAWLWATVNYPSHADVWPGYPDNGSVRGFFTRIFGPSEWRPRPRFPVPYVAAVLWAASGALLTLAALRAAGFDVRQALRSDDARAHRGRRTPSLLDRLTVPLAPDDPRGDLEIAALTVLTLLVTPIVWPHYYVVLVMPVTVLAVDLGRLILDGSILASATPTAEAPLNSEPVAPDIANVASSPAYDRRRRVLPTVGLIVLGLTSIVLGTAHYVEPFAGVGGQQLTALLALYATSLVALAWSVRGQGRGSSPAPSR